MAAIPVSNGSSRTEPKVTKLHFYMHDIVISSEPTAVEVVPQAKINGGDAAFMFGRTVAMDNPLTLDPDLANSQVFGRAQGVYVSVSQAKLHYMLVMNLVFTEGEYKGSSLTLLGDDPVFDASREMPIIGGTGAFRLARGVAKTRTYNLDETNFNAIEEYKVVIIQDQGVSDELFNDW